MQLSYRSKVVLTGFLILIIGMMLIMLSESFVRLRQWIKHGGVIEDILAIESSSGLRIPMPNKVQGAIRINSIGFRSPELVNPKPYSVVRLAFLGESTTFCSEVSSNEATWPHLVWEKLQAIKPSVKFDFINAAVPGYSVNSSLRNLQYRVKPLQPDIIVIYHGNNDLSLDTRALAIEQDIYQGSDKEQSWLSKHSKLWFLVEKNLKIKQVQKEVSHKAKLDFDSKQLSRSFKQRLKKLVRESQEAANLVAIATFSYKIRREQTREGQVKAANSALYYMPYMSIEGLLDGYEEYNRVIREIARETDVLLIEGETDIPGNDTYFVDSIHFTDAGSKLMAKRISDALLNSNDFKRIIQSKK